MPIANNSYQLKRRAERMVEAGELENAADAYNRASEVSNDAELPVKAASLFKQAGNLAQSATAFVEAAVRFAEQGNYLRSLSLCAKALALDPGNPVVVELLNARFRPAAEEGKLEGEAKIKYVALAAEAFKGKGVQPQREAVWGDAILAVLRNIKIFSHLADSEIVTLVKGVQVKEFAPKQTIVSQGDPGRDFYVLVKGKCVVTIKAQDGSEKELRQLSDGQFFGEVSFFMDVPRTATVKALAPCEVLEFQSSVLRPLMASSPKIKDILNRFFRERMLDSVMATSEVFSGMTALERQKLINLFEPVEAPKGTLLIKEGTESPGLFIIAAGDVVAYSKIGAGRTVSYPTMHAGDLFGEISFVMRRPPTATCQAATDVKLFKLPPNQLGFMLRMFPGVLSLLKKKSAERMARTERAISKLSGAKV